MVVREGTTKLTSEDDWKVSPYDLTAGQLEPYVRFADGPVTMQFVEEENRFKVAVHISSTQALVGYGESLHMAILAALQFYPTLKEEGSDGC